MDKTHKINSSIYTDENYYFFSLLTDRFQPLNMLWAEGLERRFGKKFKPISIVPFQHNKLFEEENYIVLNKQSDSLVETIKKEKMIALIYPEDLNKQFCASPLVQKMIRKLIKKQGRLFILSFTNVWLDIKNPNITLLGPRSDIAAKFDDKKEHIKVFKQLNLPINKTWSFNNFEALKEKQTEYPFFLSAEFSSGGIESKVIYTKEELEAFYFSLRPINKKGSFIVSRLLTDIVLAPNTSAIVLGENKTVLVCITDQILRDNRYMGNFYPTRAQQTQQALMTDMTIRVGNFLSRQGFRGLFGLDFLITQKGHCYPSDLNPRRQGGYFCNVMMSKKINLIDLELRLALGEPLPEINPKDFQVNYCWGHSKLTPYFGNVEIKKEFEVGSSNEPFDKIGSTYKAIYYPSKHILIIGNPGFYLTSDRTYSRMKKRLIQETEKLLSESFGLYKGL